MIEKVVALRKHLHAHPEPSEQEVETRKTLMKFIEDNTKNTKIVDKGRWFYAIKEEVGAKETIALRADHDAIISEDGKAFHGCGHDGHSAILAGTVLALDEAQTGKNVVYIFQHAEENGAGAKECVAIFDEVKIDRIYGLHNFPGFAKGEVYSIPGTMMCASKGMSLAFEGKQSHASEPENGNNPVYPMAKLVELVAPLVEFHGYKPVDWNGEHFEDMVLCTIVSAKVGEQGAFGVSPSRGELGFTLRAARLEDLDHLSEVVEREATRLAEEAGVKVSFSYTDEFPDTANTFEEYRRLQDLLPKEGIPFHRLEQPFRGSEDFGWFTKHVPGCYMVLGSGEDYTPLHTIGYDFPDEIIPAGIKTFCAIVRG